MAGRVHGFAILRAAGLAGFAMTFCLGSPARADVVLAPPEGYTLVEELGELAVEDQYRTPSGIPFTPAMKPPYGLIARAVSWAPADTPVLAFVQRDRAGYWIFLGSTLTDRKGRSLCWSEQPIAAAQARDAAGLWRALRGAFDGWAAQCATARTLGEERLRGLLAARERDFRRGFARLHRTRQAEFVPSERMAGIPSFLPSTVSQPLLDAIADACEGPRERVRLEADGAITFDYSPHVPYGADGSRPFDSCVNDQIRYFPGYRKPD